MKSVLYPHTGRMIVQMKKEELKKGGILLPDAVPERICIALVKETADGSDFRIGDSVVIDSYITQKVKIADEEYLILKECDVLGYVECEDKSLCSKDK